MIAAVVGMIVWEGWGRDALLLREVIVASREIAAGQLLQEEDFQIIGVPEDCLIEGALTASDIPGLRGAYAVNSMAKNQQLSLLDVAQERQLLQGEQTSFVIPEEWIAMRSSSLRKGDMVTLYNLTDYTSLGTYAVAFVKDEQEQEIRSLEGIDNQKVLSRTDSNAPVHHLEILAELEQYLTIRQAAFDGGGLLVVQSNRIFDGGKVPSENAKEDETKEGTDNPDGEEVQGQ